MRAALTHSVLCNVKLQRGLNFVDSKPRLRIAGGRWGLPATGQGVGPGRACSLHSRRVAGSNVLVRIVRLRLEAVVELPAQPAAELQAALHIGLGVLLGLQLGIVVRELVEQDGDWHAIQDDAEGDAAERHTAAQIGDGNHIPVAHCGDAHLQAHRKLLSGRQEVVIRQTESYYQADRKLLSGRQESGREGKGQWLEHLTVD